MGTVTELSENAARVQDGGRHLFCLAIQQQERQLQQQHDQDMHAMLLQQHSCERAMRHCRDLFITSSLSTSSSISSTTFCEMPPPPPPLAPPAPASALDGPSRTPPPSSLKRRTSLRSIAPTNSRSDPGAEPARRLGRQSKRQNSDELTHKNETLMT